MCICGSMDLEAHQSQKSTSGYPNKINSFFVGKRISALQLYRPVIDFEEVSNSFVDHFICSTRYLETFLTDPVTILVLLVFCQLLYPWLLEWFPGPNIWFINHLMDKFNAQGGAKRQSTDYGIGNNSEIVGCVLMISFFVRKSNRVWRTG